MRNEVKRIIHEEFLELVQKSKATLEKITIKSVGTS